MEISTLVNLLLSVIVVSLTSTQGQSHLSWLNDVDGDNIPGQAGVDYPVYNTVPKETSFRCSDYDYAGYFGDVETDCQAYHVCFPDGRNASFLCVNGTVFHQRFFVCDWWFHFNCSYGPNLYDLNLYRKVPLPVLPPVQRKPFPGPIPQPKAELIPVQPRTQFRDPKKLTIDPLENGKENMRNKDRQNTQKEGQNIQKERQNTQNERQNIQKERQNTQKENPSKWERPLNSAKQRNDRKNSEREKNRNQWNDPHSREKTYEKCECECNPKHPFI